MFTTTLNSIQAAIEYYERALRVEPRNANVRTDMGTAYFYLGDSDRAIQEFQASLKDDPKHGANHVQHGDGAMARQRRCARRGRNLGEAVEDRPRLS